MEKPSPRPVSRQVPGPLTSLSADSLSARGMVPPAGADLARIRGWQDPGGRPDDLATALTELLEEVLTNNLKKLFGFLTGFVTAQTIHHSIPGFYVPSGDIMHLWVGNIDDDAEFYMNDKYLGGMHLDDPGTWLLADHIRPGFNLLAIKLENSGLWAYNADVFLRRNGDTGRDLVPGGYHLEGGDGPFPNTHLITCRFFGR